MAEGVTTRKNMARVKQLQMVLYCWTRKGNRGQERGRVSMLRASTCHLKTRREGRPSTGRPLLTAGDSGRFGDLQGECC